MLRYQIVILIWPISTKVSIWLQVQDHRHSIRRTQQKKKTKSKTPTVKYLQKAKLFLTIVILSLFQYFAFRIQFFCCLDIGLQKNMTTARRSISVRHLCKVHSTQLHFYSNYEVCSLLLSARSCVSHGHLGTAAEFPPAPQACDRVLDVCKWCATDSGRSIQALYRLKLQQGW